MKIRLPPPWFRMPGIKLPKCIADAMPFILVIICIASARSIDSEAVVFAVFLISLAIYVWRSYTPRIFVGTALFLLMASVALLAGGSERYANEVAIWAYYFLVVGVLGLFIEYLRERHED